MKAASHQAGIMAVDRPLIAWPHAHGLGCGRGGSAVAKKVAVQGKSARDRILLAAVRRFASASYEEVSLRDIASDVGVDVALRPSQLRFEANLFEAALQAAAGGTPFDELGDVAPDDFAAALVDGLPSSSRPDHTSRLATLSAFSWMNSRLGSTSSPMRRENRESGVGCVRHLDLQQRAGVRVERGFPQLLRVHLAQSLVALQGQPLAAGREDGVEQGHRAGDVLALVVATQDRRLVVDLLQTLGIAVDGACVGRADQRGVE